ncbi:MAG: AraC family transcriptional regulator [Spartobacteria bacterium]
MKHFVPAGQHYHYASGFFDSPVPSNFHDHDFYEIFWVEEGEGVHHINHRKRALRQGMVVLVKDTDIHAISAGAEKTMRIVNLAFSKRSWDDLFKRYFPEEKDPMQLTSPSREIPLRSEDFLAIRRQSQRLNSAVRSKAQLDFFLLEILFMARHSTVSESQRRVVPDWLNAACLGIKKTEHLPQGLESFYRLAGRSPDHVARACRTHLGISPTEIVNAARLEHAAARLSGSDDTILAIADDCGLPNIAHFYKLFAARFGTTPRRYRIQAQLIIGQSSPAKKGQRTRSQ